MKKVFFPISLFCTCNLNLCSKLSCLKTLLYIRFFSLKMTSFLSALLWTKKKILTATIRTFSNQCRPSVTLSHRLRAFFLWQVFSLSLKECPSLSVMMLVTSRNIHFCQNGTFKKFLNSKKTCDISAKHHFIQFWRKYQT